MSLGAADKVVVRIIDVMGNEKDSFLVGRGTHLWTFLRKRALLPDSGCSGVGGCGRCAVKLWPVDLCPVGSGEAEALHRLNLPAGIRLSCHVFVSVDCTVQLLGGTS